MSNTQNPSGNTRNPPKNVLMEEFEKLRKETAGINSLFQNKTIGNSAGLVSNSILHEIRDMIGKMAGKLEKLEEKIEKLEEFIENSTEGNRRVKIEIKEQLNVTDQKIEENHKDLDMKIQNTLKKLENSKEKKAESEYIDILLKHEYVDRVTPVKVKTTDKISILDAHIPESYFSCDPIAYFIVDQNGKGAKKLRENKKINIPYEHLDKNSTFVEATIKNGDVIFYF